MTDATGPHRRRPWLAPLVARSPAEHHRAATPLELFFDLVIVVAVAQAATGLHHALGAGHAAEGALSYCIVFFGVWWCWVNFTWMASAYDNDDVVYRLMVFVQLTGAVVFAAGIPGFAAGDRALAVGGYVIMRMALAVQWLRAARDDPPRRTTALRYARGVLAVQGLWVGMLYLPESLAFPAVCALIVCELLVPAWAEHAGPTTWHPHHIAERYGLFTIITLGESILALTMAVQATELSGVDYLRLLPVFGGGLLIVFACFWLYFDWPAHEALRSVRAAFCWGYGHYFVFAAAAAIGAGLAVAVDHAAHRVHAGAGAAAAGAGHAALPAHLSDFAAGAAVAVPVLVYLASLWALHASRSHTVVTRVVAPLVMLGILLSPWTGHAVIVTGVLLAVLAGCKIRWPAHPARSA